ncbi:MAG: hypothetical protein GEV10_06390 [Streptosporangiales bacterium]|nr:hypothetical protein [Streptosporangiales bacterium]
MENERLGGLRAIRDSLAEKAVQLAEYRARVDHNGRPLPRGADNGVRQAGEVLPDDTPPAAA